MSEAPAETIEDFEALSMTQTAFNRYAITNRASGTVHTVDMAAPDCSCPDFQLGTSSDSGEACKHVLYVGFQASRNTDTSEHILRFLSNEAQAVEQAAQSIEQTATSIEAYQQSDGTQAGTEPADDAGGSAVDDVERVRSWLLSHDVPVGDGVDVYEHDRYGSVQIETTGYLEDDEFQALKDATDTGFVSYDQNNDLNYIPEDQLSEVPV